jgi:hypothetical protein
MLRVILKQRSVFSDRLPTRIAVPIPAGIRPGIDTHVIFGVLKSGQAYDPTKAFPSHYPRSVAVQSSDLSTPRIA